MDSLQDQNLSAIGLIPMKALAHVLSSGNVLSLDYASQSFVISKVGEMSSTIAEQVSSDAVEAAILSAVPAASAAVMPLVEEKLGEAMLSVDSKIEEMEEKIREMIESGGLSDVVLNVLSTSPDDAYSTIINSKTPGGINRVIQTISAESGLVWSIVADGTGDNEAIIDCNTNSIRDGREDA